MVSVKSALTFSYVMNPKGTIMSLTTDSDGKVSPDLDVGNSRDASAASDDWSSNGVIIWDPVNKIIGAGTIS